VLIDRMKSSSIAVYTDGSCNPQYEMGAWASILFIDEEKLVLSASEENTTHQRMELTAAIKAFEYLARVNLAGTSIQVFTDSQYVMDIPRRSARLKATSFLTKNNSPINNADLLQELITYIEKLKPSL
jgi:ribonuclease HI